MEVLDSRRLTGPNLLGDRPGAVLDVALLPGDDGPAAAAAWQRQARQLLDAVGWSCEALYARHFPGGMSLVLTAPIDALYAATDVNERAWERAVSELAGTPADALTTVAAELRARIAAEARPELLALAEAARRHRVAFLTDDDAASVGLGAGVRTWPVAALPSPSEIDWAAVHDVPIVLVTGTNGKTTTVRLLAAIGRAAGKTVGLSSTDGVGIAGEALEAGDWSGPGGARRVLRDPRVELAVLETARGGMLRRGLAVTRADIAIVTNVADDHLGEWGVHDLDALAETKLIVARAAARLVFSAGDPVVRRQAAALGPKIVWTSLEPPDAELLASTGDGWLYRASDDALIRERRGEAETIAPFAAVPMTLGGAARHNVANALAAAAAALELGLPLAAVRAGLAAFHSTAADNPGRLNRFDLGGVHAIVDFAHNPHGTAALLAMARALPAARRLVLLGQAGDRDDAAIRELARLAWDAGFDHFVVKELLKNLRGRDVGAVPRLLADELLRLGAPAAAVTTAPSELAAVTSALAWARPGDLLLLIVHEEREPVLEHLARLEREGWRPGDAPPSI